MIDALFQYEAASRIVLDAVLILVLKLFISRHCKRNVALLPEFTIASGAGVQIVNPKTQHKSWLTGSVDYAIVDFPKEDDSAHGKQWIIFVSHWDVDFLKARLLSSGVDTYQLSHFNSHFMIVEAKRQRVSPIDHLPEAVGQAVALSELTG